MDLQRAVHQLNPPLVAPASPPAACAGGSAGDVAAGLGWSSLGMASAEDAAALKLADLKAAARTLGLKVSGKKAELVERIDAAFAASEASVETAGSASDEVQDQYSDMSTESLRDGVRARCLSAGDDRASLLRAIRHDDLYARALLNEYGEAGTPAWVSPLPTAQAPVPPAKLPAPAQVGAKSVALLTTVPGRPASEPPASEPLASELGPGATAVVLPEVAEAVAAAARAEVLLRSKFGAVTGRPGAKRFREVTVRSLGMRPTKFTAAGLPAVSVDVLRALAGKQLPDGSLDEAKCGDAFTFFGAGERGLVACRALDALCRMGSIDTMISSFIEPLQKLADENSRVHCSLNLNTETGRLSARRPNLQNQPALEKDQYKVTSALRASSAGVCLPPEYARCHLRVRLFILKNRFEMRSHARRVTC